MDMPGGDKGIPNRDYDRRSRPFKTEDHIETVQLLYQLREKSPQIFRHILGVIRAIVKM